MKAIREKLVKEREEHTRAINAHKARIQELESALIRIELLVDDATVMDQNKLLMIRQVISTPPKRET